jgi:hypothetical protein
MNDLIRILPGWDISGYEALFSDNFFIDNLPEDLKAESAMIFEKAGEIIHIGEIVPENSLRGSFVMEGSDGNITVRFTLSPEATPRIQAFSIALTSKR